MAADVAFVALIAIAWPLYEWYADWPRFMRRVERGVAHARSKEYATTIAVDWGLAAVGLAVWASGVRAWRTMGLTVPEGWRLWVGVAVPVLLSALYLAQASALAKSERARARVRGSLGRLKALLPRTRTELALFLLLALTAGVCEELLFRGYLVSTLAPWLGWWGAALLALVPFGLLHAYQGHEGIVRTAVVGGLLTLLWAGTRSLFVAMAVHAVIDLGSGLVTWIVLREESAEPTRLAG
jgi:CAAX protease family protein